MSVQTKVISPITSEKLVPSSKGISKEVPSNIELTNFTSNAIQGWKRELDQWQSEALNYQKLLLVSGGNVVNRFDLLDHPDRPFAGLIDREIPKFQMALKRYFQQNDFDKKGLLQLQDEFQAIKAQFNVVKNLVLEHLVKQYPITFV